MEGTAPTDGSFVYWFEDIALSRRQRGFDSHPVFLIFDNSAHHNAPDDVAAACRLAMAKVRVQLPLGALQSPKPVGPLVNVARCSPAAPPASGSQAGCRKAWYSAGHRAQHGRREHETAGSNPAILTFLAVGPVLVRVGGC